ncbi:MAG: FAD-dependent oxidoreductase [Pseudolabrys sp.]
MEVAIVGGGICGLSLALHLKQRGIDARVYERAPEIKASRTARAASTTASASSSTRSRAASSPAISTRRSASTAASCI